MKIRLLAAALMALPAIAAAQAQKGLPTKEPAKPAVAARADGNVAVVNGVVVSKARMDIMLQQQQARGAQDNEQTRALLREELVNRELISQAAQKSAIPKGAEVQAQLELARQEVIVSAYLRDWVRKNPITDAEVQKEYERIKLQQGEREFKARHILVETENQAKSVIADLKKGGNFEDLAKKNSKDQGSAERGGDLNWNVPSAYDKQFADAMVKLEKGRVTDVPVRTRFGFHVIQLEDMRPVKFPALTDVRPRIQQLLVQARVGELIKGLRSKAKIE